MSKKIILSLFLFIGLFHFSIAQDVYVKNELVDIQNYVFGLHLNDRFNEIKGEAQVTVLFKENAVPFALDLIQKLGEFGMEVTEVLDGDSNANYSYTNMFHIINYLCLDIFLPYYTFLITIQIPQN